jgi:hypothetical protein
MTAKLSTEHASLARFEQTLHILRTSYISPGWKLDEAAAKLALQYFQRLARGGRDLARERNAAFRFIRDCGISLDWICGGNIGPMICQAAVRRSA